MEKDEHGFLDEQVSGQIDFALLSALRELEGDRSPAEVGKKILGRWRKKEELTLAERWFMHKWVEISQETRRRLGEERMSVAKLDRETGLVLEDFVLEAVKKDLELAALLIASRKVG